VLVRATVLVALVRVGVAVPMIVPVLVVMTIVGMVVIVTVAVVVMVVPALMTIRGRVRIGATFGFERRFDRDQTAAEVLQHGLDRRIAPQPQLAVENLHRHVPIAEMPGETGERGKVGGAHLDQRLGLGHHLDQTSILEHQRIVGSQPHRFGKIELHAGALDAEQKALLRLALRER